MDMTWVRFQKMHESLWTMLRMSNNTRSELDDERDVREG